MIHNWLLLTEFKEIIKKYYAFENTELYTPSGKKHDK